MAVDPDALAAGRGSWRDVPLCVREVLVHLIRQQLQIVDELRARRKQPTPQQPQRSPGAARRSTTSPSVASAPRRQQLSARPPWQGPMEWDASAAIAARTAAAAQRGAPTAARLKELYDASKRCLDIAADVARRPPPAAAAAEDLSAFTETVEELRQALGGAVERNRWLLAHYTTPAEKLHIASPGWTIRTQEERRRDTECLAGKVGAARRGAARRAEEAAARARRLPPERHEAPPHPAPAARADSAPPPPPSGGGIGVSPCAAGAAEAPLQQLGPRHGDPLPRPRSALDTHSGSTSVSGSGPRGAASAQRLGSGGSGGAGLGATTPQATAVLVDSTSHSSSPSDTPLRPPPARSPCRARPGDYSPRSVSSSQPSPSPRGPGSAAAAVLAAPVPSTQTVPVWEPLQPSRSAAASGAGLPRVYAAGDDSSSSSSSGRGGRSALRSAPGPGAE